MHRTGVPPSKSGRRTVLARTGVPPSPPQGQNSRVSTCYMAGSMPLVFTQVFLLVGNVTAMAVNVNFADTYLAWVSVNFFIILTNNLPVLVFCVVNISWSVEQSFTVVAFLFYSLELGLTVVLFYFRTLGGC